MASVNERKKRAFRQTKTWRTFRHNIYVRDGGRDYITSKRLLKGFECHHFCLDVDRYKELDEENFLCLNKLTHKFIHWIYPLYIKDSKIIDRLIEVLEKMRRLNKE